MKKLLMILSIIFVLASCSDDLLENEIVVEIEQENLDPSEYDDDDTNGGN